MKNDIQNRPLIILLKFDIIDGPMTKIGSPQDIGEIGNLRSLGGGGMSGGVNGMGGRPPQASNTYIKPENAYNTSNNNNGYGGHSSSAPIMRTTTPSSSFRPITPIAQLNIYQNRWTIKVRITSKSQIRTWSNAKGEGQLFSVELLDATSDIRATFFRDAVDKFYDMLEVDNVYMMTGGKLKAANMQYNNCKSSYEITFDQNAEISKVDDTGEIQTQSYSIVPIASLENVQPGGYVDVIGVVKNVGVPGTILSKKSGRELSKCELTIADDSGADVQVTIWGERAMRAPQDFANNIVVAFRKARLSDYGGRTLSANGDGIIPNPKVPDTNRVLNWWRTGGSSGGMTKSLSTTGGGGAGRFPKFEERKTIASIKNENLGYTNPEKPDWISFKGTISYIKSDREGGAWYTACPNPDDPCKMRRKILPDPSSDGYYHCEHCHQNYPNCVHRYIFPVIVSDDTSSSYLSVFDDQAKQLLDDVSADDMYKIYTGDQDGYDGRFAKATFTDWIFTCKVKQEVYDGDMRVKTLVHSVHPVDYVKEAQSLLDSILSM